MALPFALHEACREAHAVHMMLNIRSEEFSRAKHEKHALTCSHSSKRIMTGAGPDPGTSCACRLSGQEPAE